MNLWLGLLLVVVLIIITAFFVAVEFALVSVRKTRLEQLAAEGNSAAELVRRAVEKLNSYLAAAQVGITMATIGLGTLGEPVVAQLFVPLFGELFGHDNPGVLVSAHGVSFVLALLLVTMLELILGETVPKIAAIQRAEGTSMLFIRPMNFFMLVFTPFVWLINLLSGAILRLVGLPADAGHRAAYTVEELELIVASSRQAGILDRDEEVILRRVFDFGDLTARQVMRPRTDVEALPVDATIEDILQVLLEHRHTRYPVYEGSVDKVVGILHVMDILPYLGLSHGRNQAGAAPVAPSALSLRTLIRPPVVVPETLDVADILPQMQRSGRQMVVVVDEYGGTAGIITLEDIIEEIVGEVRDEFESQEATERIVSTPEGTIVDGLVSIDEVNEVLGLQVEAEADTLGGYVFELLGRKPELGDEVEQNGHVLRVEELDGLRIAKVRIVGGGAIPKVSIEE